MDVVEYLHRQAAELRELAKAEPDLDLRTRLEILARDCERLASHMGGNGKSHREPS